MAVGPLDKRSGLVSHVNSHLLLQVSVLNTLCQRETTCSFVRHDFRQPIEPSPGIGHRARPKLCGQERPNPSPPPHTLLTAGEQQSQYKWMSQTASKMACTAWLKLEKTETKNETCICFFQTSVKVIWEL